MPIAPLPAGACVPRVPTRPPELLEAFQRSMCGVFRWPHRLRRRSRAGRTPPAGPARAAVGWPVPAHGTRRAPD
eukprot:2796761-Alexandrium_andersonii.AAC.1